MTECFDPEVRDFLPDLVHGRLGEVDTATMLAHVEACDSCGAELALLREVRASARLAPAIDAAQIVSALPAPRVAAVPIEAPARRSSPGSMLRVAAASVVLVLGGLVANDIRSRGDESSITTVAQTQAAPESVSMTEKVTAAEAPKAGAPEASLSLVAGVQDLTDAQIETLLSELNDLETLPSAEPDQAVIPIDVSGE
jgi:anti-sigma factor RsiW